MRFRGGLLLSASSFEYAFHGVIALVARLATAHAGHNRRARDILQSALRLQSFNSCQELIGRIKTAGGQAQMLNPPERGMHGNSHMIMQDKNNLQIAEL